jgi:hypothetical protein
VGQSLGQEEPGQGQSQRLPRVSPGCLLDGIRRRWVSCSCPGPSPDS